MNGGAGARWGDRQENDVSFPNRHQRVPRPIPLTSGVKKASKELKDRKPRMVTGSLTNFGGGSAMRIGYAWVSTHDQNLDLQKDALKKAGCEKVIVDVASGEKEKRSGLDRARAQLRKGDVLVVWRLDRLGRSLKHLIELINEMEREGIGFCSLQESINTTTPGGKLVFHIFGALAEFERDLIRERTKPGLDAARRAGGRAVARRRWTWSNGRWRWTCTSSGNTRWRRSAGRWGSRSRRCTATCTRNERDPAREGGCRRARARSKERRAGGEKAVAEGPPPRSGLVQRILSFIVQQPKPG